MSKNIRGFQYYSKAYVMEIVSIPLLAKVLLYAKNIVA
jgi:hypothetical protein